MLFIIEHGRRKILHFNATYLALGKIDECKEWLEKAYDEKHALIIHFTLPPIFQRLRSHPRYKALLQKMNLEA